MVPIDATIAVTGMNATDNPAPGVAVARSLRHEKTFRGKIVGLGYDSLDPGFYAEGLLDGGAILPYPSAGRDALLARIRQCHSLMPIDVLLPTLDSELRAMVAIAPLLASDGIKTFLPTLDSIERASKPKLPKLAEIKGISIPDSEAITSVDGLSKLIRSWGLPLVVKGVYYGASVVYTEDDAIHAFHRFVSQWGVPVIVQKHVKGEEYNVAAVGDGNGNTVGAVAMRKMMLTDKGKGWCGVTLDNPQLTTLTEAIIGALRWRGPLEIEVVQDMETQTPNVIEINPRFPAWIYLSAGAGQNLPYLCTLLALGLPLPSPVPRYRSGTLFVRISVDQIADLSAFEQLSGTGLLLARKGVE